MLIVAVGEVNSQARQNNIIYLPNMDNQAIDGGVRLVLFNPAFSHNFYSVANKSGPEPFQLNIAFAVTHSYFTFCNGSALLNHILIEIWQSLSYKLLTAMESRQ
jgi:hypothetical protein